MNTKRQYTIGEIAAETGLTRRALRLYEKAGLLTPVRGDNNYRLYTELDKQKAEIVHQLRQGGLGLDIIRQLFTVKQEKLTKLEKTKQAGAILKTAKKLLIQKQAQIEQSLLYIEGELRSIEVYQEQLIQSESEKS